MTCVRKATFAFTFTTFVIGVLLAIALLVTAASGYLHRTKAEIAQEVFELMQQKEDAKPDVWEAVGGLQHESAILSR